MSAILQYIERIQTSICPYKIYFLSRCVQKPSIDLKNYDHPNFMFHIDIFYRIPCVHMVLACSNNVSVYARNYIAAGISTREKAEAKIEEISGVSDCRAFHTVICLVIFTKQEEKKHWITKASSVHLEQQGWDRIDGYTETKRM